jgi:hypothetical protein
MEASARHTAENERLREELKSANSEIELLSKHIDDLKQQVKNHRCICFIFSVILFYDKFSPFDFHITMYQSFSSLSF